MTTPANLTDLLRSYGWVGLGVIGAVWAVFGPWSAVILTALSLVAVVGAWARGSRWGQLLLWVVAAVVVYLNGWLIVTYVGASALVGAAAWGLLFGVVGYFRGRSFVAWTVIAYLFFIIGAAILLLLPAQPEVAAARRRGMGGRRAGMVECRHCARLVSVEDEFCRCGDRVRRPQPPR